MLDEELCGGAGGSDERAAAVARDRSVVKAGRIRRGVHRERDHVCDMPQRPRLNQCYCERAFSAATLACSGERAVGG